MKRWWLLFLYLVAVFVTTALLSPWIYQWTHHAGEYPFHRYVDRILMISALLWLIPLGPRFLAGRKPEWFRPGSFADGLVGFLLGIVSLGILAWMNREQVYWSPTWLALGVALLVALLEELLFRGVVQSIFVGDLGKWTGWILTALLFGALHFLRVPASISDSPITAWSGWQALGGAFGGFADAGWVGQRFVVLTLAGLILGGMVFRTSGLSFSIGLHAGWIVMVKSVRVTSGPDLLYGSLTFLLLLLLGGGLWKFYPARGFAGRKRV